MVTPLSTKQASVSIYCDYQNVKLDEKTVSLLQNFAKSIGTLLKTKIYYNSLSNNKCLGIPNVTYKDVPCPLKNSLDNQIVFDLIKDIRKSQSPDIIILVSGDGDFVDLVETLKEKGKHVIVVAQSGNVKAELIESASKFYYLNSLQQLMVEFAESLTLEVTTEIESPELNYCEAIKYLIQAVQTALSQNKSTKLSYIDGLMRKSFPLYQGCRCIRTESGNKFSRFSKFINAVVDDGKIIMKDNQLFLA
ncbi:hypothetical protein NIES2101_14590 [Calothrix sp. HK-06]|nr:hypothetical protein NIES2101_14590 [Calothrix sp. HK-06]